ncbi:MAG: hypothetical protein ACLFUH_11145 [Bacteroidales bacterium]
MMFTARDLKEYLNKCSDDILDDHVTIHNDDTGENHLMYNALVKKDNENNKYLMVTIL